MRVCGGISCMHEDTFLLDANDKYFLSDKYFLFTVEHKI